MLPLIYHVILDGDILSVGVSFPLPQNCDVWQEFIKRIGLINIQSYFLYVRLTYRFRNIRGPSFFLLPKRLASNLILLVKVCAGQATLSFGRSDNREMIPSASRYSLKSPSQNSDVVQLDCLPMKVRLK